MKNKFALEGSSFAGKTTIARGIERQEPEVFKAVQEYVFYAGGSEKFPSFPPKNKEEALKNLEFFVNLERKRHEDIQKIQEEKNKIVVMDRSVITLLGFEFVQRYFSGIDIFREAKELLKSEPELAPDFILWMDVSQESVKKRLKASQRKIGKLFVDKDFNENLRKFFNWLKEHEEYPMVRVDAEKSIEEVQKDVTDIIKKINSVK